MDEGPNEYPDQMSPGHRLPWTIASGILLQPSHLHPTLTGSQTNRANSRLTNRCFPLPPPPDPRMCQPLLLPPPGLEKEEQGRVGEERRVVSHLRDASAQSGLVLLLPVHGEGGAVEGSEEGPIAHLLPEATVSVGLTGGPALVATSHQGLLAEAPTRLV